MNTSFPPAHKPSPRRPRLVAAIALALLAAGCGRNVGKAAQFESQGDGLLAGGDPVRAAEAFQKALTYDSNDSDRWLKLARTRRDLNQPQLAAYAFQQAFDLDPASVEAMQNLVVLYISARQFDQAEQVTEPLLALSPDDIAGLLGTGAIAYYRERYAEANRIADRLIALAPDSKEGFLLKAHVLQKTGRTAQGVRLLEGRLKITPDDADLARQLLELYQSMGSVDGVRSVAVRLARLDPDDPRYQLESLRAFQARGDVAERERVTAYLTGRYKDNPSILGAVADFWMGALPAPEATGRIAGLAAQTGSRAKAALVGRLVAMRAYNQAAALLDPVAGQAPTTATIDLHAMRSALQMARGDVAAAHREADAVLAFDGANDVALLTRARAFLAERAYDKALVDAQLIVANDPGQEAASLLIPQIYAAQGNDALAASAFGDAQARAPESIAVARARTAWLIGKGRAVEAAQIAGLFARGRSRDDAWALYRQTCEAAHDPICLAQARARGDA